MPTVSDVQPRSNTPTPPPDTAGATALHLVHAGNVAGDTSVARDDTGVTKAGHKQGYAFVPVVGYSWDEAGLVLAASASRLLDGKEPYPVIFANGEDMDRFKAALADVRLWEADVDHASPEAAMRFAATEPGRITTIDDKAAGLLRTLDKDRTKLYIAMHGLPGWPGFPYFSAEDQASCFTGDQLARQLKDAGLDPGYRHIRLWSCHGATVPPNGGPTTAEHVVEALGNAGFEDVELSAFPSGLHFLGEPSDDGKHHRTVLVGKDQIRVRASLARVTTTYAAVKQGPVDSAYVPDEPVDGPYVPLIADGDDSDAVPGKDAPADVPRTSALTPSARDESSVPLPGFAAGSLDFADMRRVGDKPGGIAEGGIYEDRAGIRWLVKSYPNDRAAVNEHVAMQLFAEVGLRVPVTKLVALEGAHGGGTGIASQWIDGLTPLDSSDPSHRRQLQENFALYAWLGAWDVIGRFEDNVAFKDGALVHLDGGCALYCRATGGLKGTGFPEHVLEVDAMRALDSAVEIDASTRAVFGAMSQAELERSAHRFGAQAGHLSRDRLRELTAPYGSLSAGLVDRLVARRDDLLERDFNTGEDRIDRVLGISAEQSAMALRKKRLSTRPEDLAMSDKEYAAVDHYTRGGYSEINRVLRGEATSDDPVRFGKALDTMLQGVDARRAAQRPEEVRKLHRIHRGDTDALEAGGTYRSAGFLSTSANRDIVDALVVENTGRAAKWVMFGKSGIDVSSMGTTPDEQETLFKPGTPFNVLTTGIANGRPVAVLEEAGMPPEAGRSHGQRFIEGSIDGAPSQAKALPRTGSAPLLTAQADAGPAPATKADAPHSPPVSPLEKRYAALAELRDIASHLADAEPPSAAIAGKLLEKELVARMTGILCRLPDASRRTAADQRAFQGVIDYMDLLADRLDGGHLPAATAFERLSHPLKFNGRDTGFLLATASMAGSHARTAHALGDLLAAMRRAPVEGIDAARLRHDLLRLHGEGGLWRGDKYSEFYGRAFHDGRLSKSADSRFVLAYRLARENLIPTKSESRQVVSSQRADKYLRAAKRAAAIASTPAGWHALDHARPAMRELCHDIVDRHSSETLASSQARESRRLDAQLREERRSQALSHVEGIVAQTVQDAWNEAMDEARRHMRPSLLSWFLNLGAASIWNDAADGLPALAPPELVRGTLEKVLQSPRMIEWVGQLEPLPASSAVASAPPEIGEAVRAQLDVQRDRTVQAARDQALRGVGKEAARAARDAEAVAMQQARREAQDRARKEARQAVEDQQRRVLRESPTPMRDVREDLGGLREHLQRQAEAREQQAARAAAEEAVRERARDLERRTDEEMERMLGQVRAISDNLYASPMREATNRRKDADLLALADRVLAGFDWQVRNFEQWDASRPARWA